MDKFPIRITVPAGLSVASYFENAPYWRVTKGAADWEMVLTQSRCLLELELRHVPSGVVIHRNVVPAAEGDQAALWTGILRRFTLTRPVTATVVGTHREVMQINKGFHDFVEAGMEFEVVRGNRQIASLRATSVQPGDSILRVTDYGRGIKPEDTALSLWVP